MPLYLENQAFGAMAFDLTGLKNDTPLYVGSEAGAKTTDTAAKAIDTSCARKYKDRFFFRILDVTEVNGTGLTYLDLNFYSVDTENAANSTAKSFVKLRVTKQMLADAKRTPIEVSVPSTFGRFVRLEVNTDGTASVSGSLLVTIEETFL